MSLLLSSVHVVQMGGGDLKLGIGPNHLQVVLIIDDSSLNRLFIYFQSFHVG